MKKTKIFFFLLLVLTAALFAEVKDLTVSFSKGKTYITWAEDADKTKTYNIYRSSSPIQSITGLMPIVNLPCSTSYDPRQDLHYNIVDILDTIVDGKVLSDTTGLFVYTPKIDEDVYYAITTVANGIEETSIISGTNSLSSSVTEEYWEWPHGVIRFYEDAYNDSYILLYWMDYFDWAHNQNLYVDYFAINVQRTVDDMDERPLYLVLHGWGPRAHSIPTASGTIGTVRLTVRDDYYPEVTNSWWYGVSNHYGEHDPQVGDTIVDYVAQRVIHYTRWIMADSRFKIDTNRVYVSGNSMGGGGTLRFAYHYPDIWAAAGPNIARVVYPESYTFGAEYGAESLGITARNGVPIYNWMSIPWIVQDNPAPDYPPIINKNGSADGLHPMWQHTMLYQTFAENKHAIWGEWLNQGHYAGGFGEVVPGGLFRFLKNEMYPVITNASMDDNFGYIDSIETYTANPATPYDINFDSSGIMNGYIDWTSKLHNMDLIDSDSIVLSFNDSLIDNENMLAITFRSGRDIVIWDTIMDVPIPVDTINTTADITPRRLQEFLIVKDINYTWKNVDVLTGLAIDSGVIQSDVNNLLTVVDFKISTIGNQLVITKEDTSSSVENLNLDNKNIKLVVTPNPFNPTTRINIADLNGKNIKNELLNIAIYNTSGKLLEKISSKTSSVQWNASYLPSGIYLIKATINGKTLQKKVTLLK